jgi:flagellar hook-associated protein 2
VSTPITFSGFNSIDFNQILTAVMQQERSPLTRLETQKKTLETQNSAYGTLAGKLASIKSAIEGLNDPDAMSLLKATSSNSGVGVSATTGTVSGTYDVVVTELARAQVSASQTTYGSLTTAAAAGGTLTLTLTPSGGGAATVITAPDGTTLSQLATLINDEDDSPAAASVVQTSPGVYQLVLTGKETGLSNAFTIGTSMSAGAGPTFAAASQAAGDAELTVNGLPITSASNTVSDVVPGATLSLLKKEDPPATATIKVTRDTAAAKDLVKKFMTSYNDLTTFAKEQNTAAIAGKASIGRDPLLRGLRETLRNATSEDYAGGGALENLAEIGIGFDMGGKMTLDEKLFDERFTDSAADVQLLLSGADGSGGAFGAMGELVDEYAQTGGLIAETRERIDDTIRGLNRRMDGLSAQLELRRLALQKEYIAADLAMTRLKSQSSSLSSLGGQYRLF